MHSTGPRAARHEAHKNDLKKRTSSPTSNKLNDHAPRELNTNAARRHTTSALLSATPNNLGTNNSNNKSYNIILHKFYDKFHHKFTPKNDKLKRSHDVQANADAGESSRGPSSRPHPSTATRRPGSVLPQHADAPTTTISTRTTSSMRRRTSRTYHIAFYMHSPLGAYTTYNPMQRRSHPRLGPTSRPQHRRHLDHPSVHALASRSSRTSRRQPDHPSVHALNLRVHSALPRVNHAPLDDHILVTAPRHGPNTDGT